MIKLEKIRKVYETNGIKQVALDDINLVLPDNFGKFSQNADDFFDFT